MDTRGRREGGNHAFKIVKCVRETEILEEQQHPQGVFACDHAGCGINQLDPRDLQCHMLMVKCPNADGQ